MRFLFVTYCFGNFQGQTLIGVYKRGLRLALEMSGRGHEVVFVCTGRHAYHDQLTDLAEKTISFLDIPFTVAAFEEAQKNRQVFLAEIERQKPDIVVIGEAPLAGALLEAALCSIELKVPVVFLDNAYNPLFVEHFSRFVGPMADAIILTGPSGHQMTTPPPYLRQVPPFIDSSPDAAAALIRDKLGLKGERLITVLAYDEKVEGLAASLVQALDLDDVEAVFCARVPERCEERLGQLPEQKRERIRVIPQPEDPILFGLLELSHLAIVKYGFMQVSECMALRTPVIVVYHEGPTWLDSLPESSKKFAMVTSAAEADSVTLDAARRFLYLNPGEMAQIHNGEFQAASRCADFLETLPLQPREGTLGECQEIGFSPALIKEALAIKHSEPVFKLDSLRAMRLRVRPEYDLYSLVCSYSVDEQTQFARLWGRTYASRESANVDWESAREPDSGRRVLYFSSEDCLLIEEDIGEARLPPLNF